MDRVAVKPERCRHCGRQIYLQLTPIPNTDSKWILFDYPKGSLHSCVVKPLDSWKRKMVQEYMGTNSNEDRDSNSEIVQKLTTIIEILSQIKETLINNSNNNI